MKLGPLLPTIFAVLTCSVTCWSQNRPSLADAERAYADIDLEKTRLLARQVIDQGGNDPRASARLYLLLATSAAAVDRTDEARQAFTHLLAIDSTLKLDRSLSPKVRAPYLEARGALGADSGARPLEASLALDSNELVLSLRDVLGIGGGVELFHRAPGARDFSRRTLEPLPENRLPAPTTERLEYYVRVLDAHGNTLYEKGTPGSPARLTLASSAKPTSFTSSTADAPNPTAYYVAAGAFGALSIAAGVGATLAYLQREEAAREWNSPGCERAGATRGAQCADVNERRQRSEGIAIGLSAGGGALLVGSAIALILAPSSDAGRGVTVQATPEAVGFLYRGTL